MYITSDIHLIGGGNAAFFWRKKPYETNVNCFMCGAIFLRRFSG